MRCSLMLSALIGLNCVIGFCLSVYSLQVELHAEEDPSAVAMCDISEHMSCTKVFTSRYGKGFGIIGLILGEDSVFNQPNSYAGLIFYSVVAALGLVHSARAAKFQLGLSVISNFTSVYLAYILYFILYDFCIVCVSTYVVNFINMTLAYKRYQILQTAENNAKKQN